MLNRGVGRASAFMGVRDTAVCLKLLLSLSKNPSVKLLGVSQCKSLFCGKISGCQARVLAFISASLAAVEVGETKYVGMNNHASREDFYKCLAWA